MQRKGIGFPKRSKGFRDKKQEKQVEERKLKIVKAIFRTGREFYQWEIAKAAGINKMAISRYFKLLEDDGFIEKVEGGLYKIKFPVFMPDHPTKMLRNSFRLQDLLNTAKGVRMRGSLSNSGIAVIYKPMWSLDPKTEEEIVEKIRVASKKMKFDGKRDERKIVAFIITKKRDEGLQRTIFLAQTK